ncbi:MAG: phosphopantetheine adenylyltransferase [Pseudomonadota bacterium]
MRILTTLALLVVGAIHLIPLSGVLGPEHLVRLYGAAPSDPSALILMRHRAVLFGIVGGVCVLAAFKPALQSLALVLGSFSVVSFLWLAWSTGGFNAHLQRVVVADIVALLCLAVGAAALGWAERSTPASAA